MSAANEDEARLRALEDRYAKAVNAKDLDAIMQVYAPDGEDLHVFDLVPPRQYVGTTAYRKLWQEFIATFPGTLKFEISDLKVRADRTLGYGHKVQRIVGVDNTGQAVDITLRVTEVYRKFGDDWRIVHEHVSVPVDLNSGKPDLSSNL